MTGADLRAWRTAREWTQERAAHWAGVTLRTWQRWEARTGAIPRDTTNRIKGSRHSFTRRRQRPRPIAE